MAKEISPPPPFKLLPGERESALWGRLRVELEARVESARVKLEGDLPPEVTAKVRGEIKAMRQILDFASEERTPLAWANTDRPPTKGDLKEKFGIVE